MTSDDRGRIVVDVHQSSGDLSGAILADRVVQHVWHSRQRFDHGNGDSGVTTSP
jgi:hypothetical protein